MSEAFFKLNLRPEATEEYKQAVFEAVKETFELEIKPEAVANSPVTEEGLEHNLAQGKKGVYAYGTGHNRQSIDVEVERTPDGGTKATLFTQSGYGGYLETGTSKMRAQPYLYPAFIKFLDGIAEKVKAAIG
jgi:HK97 gp10 family phage protein